MLILIVLKFKEQNAYNATKDISLLQITFVLKQIFYVKLIPYKMDFVQVVILATFYQIVNVF